MLKLDFTREEADELKAKLCLSRLQEKIFEYRMKDFSITEMAFLEDCSEPTISREIRKIKNKIKKVL